MQSSPWRSSSSGTATRHSYKHNRAPVGPLGHFGYTVADKADLSRDQRRACLRAAFDMELPLTISATIREKWGRPGSFVRLCAMLEELIGLKLQAYQRRDKRFEQAISRWNEDSLWVQRGFSDDLPKWPHQS